MKKNVGSILLAGLLFLAGCGSKALSAKDISEKLTKDPAKVSVIYIDENGKIQRQDIQDNKEVVANVADELKDYSTKVIKEKVNFKQDDTALGIEVADDTGSYNVTLYLNGYMKVQKIGDEVIVYAVTSEQIEKITSIWTDYLDTQAE